MPDKAYLRQMQILPLRAKVTMSQARIREWYEYFYGKVFISYSGGKDSTALAHMAHELYPDIPLVFCNTGLEYPEIQGFAKRMGAEFVRPKMSFSEVISTYGYPIISKENAEAIYYARRIRNSEGCVGQTTARRLEEIENRRTKTLMKDGEGQVLLESRSQSSRGYGYKRAQFFWGGYKQTGMTGEDEPLPG